MGDVKFNLLYTNRSIFEHWTQHTTNCLTNTVPPTLIVFLEDFADPPNYPHYIYWGEIIEYIDNIENGQITTKWRIKKNYFEDENITREDSENTSESTDEEDGAPDNNYYDSLLSGST